MSKAGRMTISVPQDLKERMEAVDEPVSWSAVACDAFRAKLAEITKRKGARDMKDVIMRLRASKQVSDSESYMTGMSAGEKWAKTKAAARELKRLEAWHDALEENGPVFEEWFDMEVLAPHDHAGWIAEAVTGDADDADEIFDGNRSDHAYVAGFVFGAINIWEQVQDDL